jgi:hypothetical protein
MSIQNFYVDLSLTGMNVSLGTGNLNAFSSTHQMALNASVLQLTTSNASTILEPTKITFKSNASTTHLSQQGITIDGVNTSWSKITSGSLGEAGPIGATGPTGATGPSGTVGTSVSLTTINGTESNTQMTLGSNLLMGGSVTIGSVSVDTIINGVLKNGTNITTTSATSDFWIGNDITSGRIFMGDVDGRTGAMFIGNKMNGPIHIGSELKELGSVNIGSSTTSAATNIRNLNVSTPITLGYTTIPTSTQLGGVVYGYSANNNTVLSAPYNYPASITANAVNKIANITLNIGLWMITTHISVGSTIGSYWMIGIRVGQDAFDDYTVTEPAQTGNSRGVFNFPVRVTENNTVYRLLYQSGNTNKPTALTYMAYRLA